ncbi:DNA-3-methyladenine glycosylase 2 family protein [Vibrio panuliri]|uniref:3-methyladenine DNA glycosylase n=1 Tax=Vibrio panuliri TaxID=1381081 RepID=A0ABX3FCL1_9VIBR|nr:AlkA N-terminal domain-containing protein [Vibrio panuliri]KAB1458130.1 DNA-3-methyladenine glycosylase 2 family protein [Vibrio panuliri]OLQ89487.1 3-methyladenine DNA glycosylase [Vibrio panuliri]
MLNHTEQFQRARQTRDARFDGRFFVAVKTTKIFCRPICPANLPKEENVEYFTNAALALQAGYRPCLRCRPDSAPNSWAWLGSKTTYQRAAHLIEQGALQHGSLQQLAQRLGISDRYLRQLFAKNLGMSPKQYALYHQLMFAKQLLHSSNMSMTEIGFASGFNSTRRFNDAFKKALKLAPSDLKREAGHVSSVKSLELSYRGAYDWQYTLDFYRLRAIEGLEKVGDNSYQKWVRINGDNAWFAIYFDRKPNKVVLEFELADITQLKSLVSNVRRMFDLDVDINIVEQHLQQVEPELVIRSGIRMPGVWDTWEAGVRAILGQQVSIKAAIGQLNLLVNTLQPNGVTHFPTPQEVVDADLSFLRMPQSRRETLSRFAQLISCEPEAEFSQWLALKGIGPWTVNYAALRGRSEPDRFLDGDLVVKKALKEFIQVNKETVSPFGSYATFHLWSHAG